jgi:hypothetical protein
MELLKYEEGDFYFVDVNHKSDTYMGMFIKNEEKYIFLYIMEINRFRTFKRNYIHNNYIHNFYNKIGELQC